MITLQELLTHSEAPRKIGPVSFQCKCPVHYDSKAGLTITEDRGKLLLHCHAGRETKGILETVGLTSQDLGDYRPPQWKERLEFGQGKKIEAIYDYKAAEGRYLYPKVKSEGKEIRHVTIDRRNDTYKYYKKSDYAVLYNFPTPVKAVRAGYPVYIVEGEKDTDTLNKPGCTATTAGSTSDRRREYAFYFAGAKVVILPDSDEPGMKPKDQIVKDLRHFAHSIRWVLTSMSYRGDVTGYLTKEEHSREELDELTTVSENRGAPWPFTDGEGMRAEVKINGDVLADSISRGLPYLIVRNPEEDENDFYLYEGRVYNKYNRSKVKSLIRRYAPVGMASDNMISNVYNPLLCRDSNICTFRDLDTNEGYIDLKNGLYNPKTRKLKPRAPKLKSTIQLNYEYCPEDTARPVFDRYMDGLYSDRGENADQRKKAVIQEHMGLILSNVKVYRVKQALVLRSLLENSGKTQILNLMGELLGANKIVNIPIQQMNEASKFALGSIIEKRLISIGDQTGSEIKDSSVFKQLTGGDAVKIEPKNKQPLYYIFPGGIAIACNNLLSFQDGKGGHIFERLCVVPCTNAIEQDRWDSALLDEMPKERNIIFNWSLERLHRLMDHNFKFTYSSACEGTMRDYREKLDTVYRYLSEFHIVTEDRVDMVLKAGFDSAYINWCVLNESTHVNKQNIRDRMEASGYPADRANYGEKRGVMVYRNPRKGLETDYFERITQGEYTQGKMPFN